METADNTKIQGFALRVVSNGYVLSVQADPCLQGEEYVFDSLSALQRWLSLRLPRFFSAEEKEQLLRVEPQAHGQTPTS